MLAGFAQVTQQLPKFDIDKHGNRLDKPVDPYGGSNRTTHHTLIGSAVSSCAASPPLATVIMLQTVALGRVMLHTAFWLLHNISVYFTCLSACD